MRGCKGNKQMRFSKIPGRICRPAGRTKAYMLKFGMKKQTPANTEFSAQEAANMPKNSRF